MKPNRIVVSYLIAFSLFALGSCAPQSGLPRDPGNQATHFPTPTSILDLNAGLKSTPELVSLEPVLDSTAVPVDYEAIFLAEDQSVKATIEALADANVKITASVNKRIREISPYIYGVAITEETAVQELRPSMVSWVGEDAERYNWQLGNAFNPGRAELYQNTNLFPASSDFALDYMALAQSIDAATRFSLPTVGWVAKDTFSCTFSDPACSRGRESTCLSAEVRPNPNVTSIESGPEDMVEFVNFIQESGYEFDFLGVLDEPELWGINHYDVHPDCASAEEIFDTYIEYAVPLKQAFPDIELAGPTTSDYRFYWDTLGWQNFDAGLEEEFLPWFLKSMAEHDQREGERHLDILDVRYYPQDLVNDGVEPLTIEQRLRSVKSLYDPQHVDESEINEAIFLIPRLRQMVDEYYPGTKVGLSGWNFGATQSINGAHVVADALGIMGREGLYYASFFPAIEPDTPAFYAFKLYTNYDDRGGRFGDIAIETESTLPDIITVHGSVDSQTGDLHLILINKTNDIFEFELDILFEGFAPSGRAFSYTYFPPPSEREDPGIIRQAVDVGAVRQTIVLQRESIMHLVYESR